MIDEYYDDVCGPAMQMNSNLSGHTSVRRELNARAGDYYVISAAATTEETETIDLWFGENQVGKNMTTDEGTIRTDLDVYTDLSSAGKGHHVTVRKISLNLILERLPPPTEERRWGCLKTDIQGNDFLAVKAAGPLIANFACVSMEIWTRLFLGDAYDDPIDYMLDRGLLVVREQVWNS